MAPNTAYHFRCAICSTTSASLTQCCDAWMGLYS